MVGYDELCVVAGLYKVFTSIARPVALQLLPK
jgi:hypothetical protein